MPLRNKYLEYTPEISLEIFKEIWIKLINSGWKATCDFISIENRFYEFKKGEHLYNDNSSRKSFYVNYRDIQEYIKDSDHILTETTVQEILGYDPFVKEKVIPEFVECIKSVHGNKHPHVGQVIKADEEGYLIGICSYKSVTYNECFKPSTKEAFDAQNQPKSNGFPTNGCCKSKSNELEQYLIKTRGNSDSKMAKEIANGVGWNESSYWWLLDTDKSSKRQYHLSDLEAWLDKPKQPLKQAVHCKTPEEINNHLISIGQIPKEQALSTSEIAYNHLIDYGIKVHKEFFNPTIESERKYDWKVHPKYKMTLSIEDEELPMISIIKINSIKQLLNND